MYIYLNPIHETCYYIITILTGTYKHGCLCLYISISIYVSIYPTYASNSQIFCQVTLMATSLLIWSYMCHILHICLYHNPICLVFTLDISWSLYAYSSYADILCTYMWKMNCIYYLNICTYTNFTMVILYM